MDNSHHGLVLKQGSILGPFCFNDISDDLITNVQLFASNTFLFSAVYDVNTTKILAKLMTGQYNGKWVSILIQVNKLKKLYFPEMGYNYDHESINFNHNLLQQVPSQKDYGIHLDTKLKLPSYQEHLDGIISKVDKTTALLRKPQVFLQRFHSYHL